jgi:hypothetical protein
VCSAIESAFPERDFRLGRLPLTPASVWAAMNRPVDREAESVS